MFNFNQSDLKQEQLSIYDKSNKTDQKKSIAENVIAEDECSNLSPIQSRVPKVETAEICTQTDPVEPEKAATPPSMQGECENCQVMEEQQDVFQEKFEELVADN